MTRIETPKNNTSRAAKTNRSATIEIVRLCCPEYPVQDRISTKFNDRLGAQQMSEALH